MVVVVMAAFMPVIVILVMIVVMVAALVVIIVIMVVMMVVLLLRVLGGVLQVGLLGQPAQLLHKVILALHGGQDPGAGQAVPGGGDDGGGGVLFPDQRHRRGHLVGAGGLGTAQDDAAGVADLVIVELAEVLHIQPDLVHVRHGDKAVQLHGQAFGHAFHGAGHIAELAHAGGLDQDAVGVVLLHHLLQGHAEVAHQAAADAAGVQLVDPDAGFLQKTAVDADLTELVFDQHDLLALKGLPDELFDERGLAGAQKARKNIDLGHNLRLVFLLFAAVFHSPRKCKLVALSIFSYYSKLVNGTVAFLQKNL